MSFLLAFGFSLLLMPAARRAGRILGWVDRPGSLKIHREPIPVLGGAAVLAATAIAFIIAHGGLPAGLAVAVGLALVAGIVDDRIKLPAWLRVGLLCIAGVVLGAEIVGPLEVGALGVMALVLVCSNAVNLIDGQDGLAGGLAAIAAVVFAGLLAQNQGFDTGLGLALGGSLLAFLLWNRPPARIFMGNGGAYGVGTVLALLAAENIQRAGWHGLLAAGACLGVLACEMLFTIVRRLRSGRALVSGDRAHTYDLLADRLGSRAKSTFVFWGLGGLAGATALAVDTLPLVAGIILVAVATGVSGAVASAVRSRSIRSPTPLG